MRFRRRLKTEVALNMIPMIDVVFQLVIFFMVSTTFIVTPGISLVLPTSRTAEPAAMGKLVITVVGREQIYLNKDLYSLEDLEAKLQSLSPAEREAIKTVVLEGDRAIPYSLLVEVLDVLRRSGFKGINLRTRESWSGKGS